MSKLRLISILITLLFCIVAEGSLYAGDLMVSYGGRFTNAGVPVDGPVDIEINFFRSADGGASLIGGLVENGVTLNQGVFQLDITLTAANAATLFGNGDEAVFIQVTDLSSGSTYPRQRFTSVPLALRIPINTTSLEYDSTGKLNLKSAPASSANDLTDVDTSGAGVGQVLKWDGAEWKPQNDAGVALNADDVLTGHIQDGEILDADINAAAAIATSKISGALTSVTGHGLGTAAALNVGTGNNEVVQLDGTGKLPAIDGSALTNLPLGVITAPDVTGLTAGSVPFANASGLTEDSANLFWNDTTNRLGIGSTTPAAALDVNGKIHASQICGTGDANCKDLSVAWPTGTVTSIGITQPAAGITSSGGPVTGSGSITLALADDLAAVEGLASTGGVERTALNTWGTYTLTAAGKDLLDDANVAAQQTTLSLVPGTDVQAYDAGLLSIAGLTTLADKMIYTTASDTYATADLTAAGRELINDADNVAQRVTLGLGTAAVLDVGTGNNNIVQLDGSGDLPALDGSALTGVTAAPAGADTHIQFNDSGTTAGSANLAWDNTKGILKVAGQGLGNMFVGDGAGTSYTAGGDYNTFIGDKAGYYNSTGESNVFTGYRAGEGNTTGSKNVISGYQAGRFNTSGDSNVFTGYEAGYTNTTGNNNVFTGNLAGYANTTGSSNVFTGFYAGYGNTTGTENVAIGRNAGYANTTGSQNTFIGTEAGYIGTTATLTNATAIGYGTQVTASNSLILGNGANVGIGTTSPSGILHTKDGEVWFANSSDKSNVLLVRDDGSNSANGETIGRINYTTRFNGGLSEVAIIDGMYTGDGTTRTGDLRFGTSDGGGPAERMRILANGNVGIGTTSPAEELTVASSSLPAIRISLEDGSNATNGDTVGRVEFATQYNSLISEVSHVSSVYTGDGTTRLGDILFSTSNTGAPAEKMRITYDGNVGIGTSEPAAKLDVNGTIMIQGGVPGAGKVLTSTDGTGIATWEAVSAPSGGSDFTSTSSADGTVALSVDTFSAGQTADLQQWKNNGTIQSVVDDQGNFGIGTSTPNQRLTLEGTMSLKEQAAANADTAGYGQLWVKTATPNQLWFTDDAGTDFQLNSSASGDVVNTGQAGTVEIGTNDANTLTFETNNTDRITILSTGEIGIGTTSPAGRIDFGVNALGEKLAIGLLSTAGNNWVGIGLDSTGVTGSLRFAGDQANGGSNSTIMEFGYYSADASHNWTSKMAIARTTGNVGIGTVTPGAKLHVDAGAAEVITLEDASNTVSLSMSGDRIFHDTNADGVKDGGEEFIDFAGGTPDGNTTELQFNNAGAFAGSANLAWDNTKSILKVAGPGSANMFIGINSGSSWTTGERNTFLGYSTGYANTTGKDNVFIGMSAGYKNIGGQYNVFTGYNAGYNNTTGNSNIFTGRSAGYNSTGSDNTFIGNSAGILNIGGSENVAIGGAAGSSNTTGVQNTFIGTNAGDSSTNNLTNATAIGYNTQVTASNSLILGNGANVGIGTTAPGSKLEVHDTTANGFASYSHSDTSWAGGNVMVGRSRGTQGSPTTILQDDTIGAFSTLGYDGVSYKNGPSIIFDATEDWAVGSQGTRIEFSTISNASTAVVERMRIDANGNVGIGTTIPNQLLTLDGTMSIKEQASADADTAGYGQVWVKNTVPSELWYTADDGTDVQLGAGGGSAGGADTQLQFNDGGAFAGSANLAWDNTKSILKVAGPGTQNMFIGDGAGNSYASGGDNNTFSGYFAGNLNSTGDANTFSGSWAGRANTTGSYNVFTGANSGYNNSTGNNNVFTGAYTGKTNTTGQRNVFTGHNAGQANTTGNDNVFTGYQAGYFNTTGVNNVFTGFEAGYNNTTGTDNTFSGYMAGNANITGWGNTFTGGDAGLTNTSSGNTFYGFRAGRANTSGYSNVFSGFQAGYVNTTGYRNTFIGKDAGNVGTTATLTNATALGYNTQVTASNSLILGNGANVGIGTTAPNSKLVVEGDISTGDGGIKWKTFSGTTDASGETTAFAHGLTASKVLSAICSIRYASLDYYTISSVTEVDCSRHAFWGATNLTIKYDDHTSWHSRAYRCVVQYVE